MSQVIRRRVVRPFGKTVSSRRFTFPSDRLCFWSCSLCSSCFSTLGQDSEVPCYHCHQTRRRRDVSETEGALPGVIANNTAILIRVPLQKATSHSKLLKLTTGFAKSIGFFKYQIIYSNQDGVFNVDERKEGRAVLRFSEPVTEPGIFSVEIEGQIVEREEVLAEDETNTILTEPLALLVEVEVYE